MRQRISVLLHMAMAFIVTIVVAQLWLFTVALEAMENDQASPAIAVGAMFCSVVACGGVWGLIRFFLKVERQ